MIEDATKFTTQAPPADRADDAELLVSLISAEIFATASSAQAEGFFTSVGHRLAAIVAMDDVHDLHGLTTRINALWQALGWGEVRMDVQGNGIVVHHHGLPRGWNTDASGHWPVVLRTLLTSAYDRWFRVLGSGNSLRTTVLRASEEELELYHGV
jgi:hypothetical protein